MSLDIQIRSLLVSSEVNQINFNMGGVLITGHGFWELSKCFDSKGPMRHRVRVTVNPRMVDPRALAVYNPREDKIQLRSPDVLDTLAGRATVVHECTHAQIDLRALATSIRSEEAAAYVAQAWYLLASGMPDAQVDHLVTDGIRRIAADLRSRSRSTIGPPPVDVLDYQINEARQIVALDFRYPTGHYVSNGIRGRRYHGI